MNEKWIDPYWKKKYGRSLLVTLCVIVAGVMVATFMRECNSMGKAAKQDTFIPSSEEGFIGKSNELLRELVRDGNANEIKPRSLEELNRKYPALRFELPYHEDSITASGRASDLRLVAIIADSIKKDNLRRFYYNSNLPSLLEKQRDKMGEQLFSISLGTRDPSGNTDYTWIQSIRMIPSLFKLSFEHDPWTGVIMAADNELIGERNHCFISWGMSMIPLRMASNRSLNNNNYYYAVTADESRQIFTGNNGSLINYYDCSRNYDNGRTVLHVHMRSGDFQFAYPDSNHLAIRTTDRLRCYVYDTSGMRKEILPSQASGRPDTVDFSEDLKVVAINTQNNSKTAEFTISHHNPVLTLSRLVNSNSGDERYYINSSIVDKFTQQVVYGLSSALRNNDFSDTVRLTLDPFLSLELEGMLREYYVRLNRRLPASQYELSMTVVDMSTGNVIAAPYYRSIDERLPNDVSIGLKSPTLIRRYVGSAFKPLMALAAVQSNPSLLNLNTVGHYNTNGQFYDWTINNMWDGRWGGCSNFEEFLGRSDDVYPVALAVLSMDGKYPDESYQAGQPLFTDTSNLFRPGWRLDERDLNGGVWANTPLVRNLSLLYDVNDNVDAYMVDSLSMTHYIWDNLGLDSTRHFGLDIVRPDVTNMHYDGFYGGTLRTKIVPWVLGQGDNFWCPMKFAEAWTRMLTKRKVNISIIQSAEPHPAPSLVAALGTDYADRTWNSFLDKLLEAQHIGTLAPMWNQVIVPFNQRHENNQLVIFSKTGTPENYEISENRTINRRNQWIDLGMYCMGLMTQEAFTQLKSGGNPRGVMCIIQIVRINPRNGDDGLWSSDAQGLFVRNPNNFEKFYELTKSYY